MQKIEIGIGEKYALTIKEAAVYFSIGEKKLRSMVAANVDSQTCDWMIENGNKVIIKRQKFADYLDRCSMV